MRKIDENSKKIRSALEGALPTGAQLAFLRRDGADAIFKLAGKRVRARWVAAGWPAKIQEALGDSAHSPDIIVAQHLSPGARELLSQQAIGWLDESGAAEFVLGTIVVSRTSIQQKKSEPSRSERWSPSLLAVAEALLCKTSATVEAIATATSLSSGACTKALRTLTDAGLLVADVARGPRSARRITDERRFLDTYAGVVGTSARKQEMSLEVGGTWQDLLEGITATGRRWDQQGIAWAATGTAAAEVMAPTMTTLGSAIVYVEATSLAELASIAQKAGLRPIEGGRLVLKPFPTVTSRNLASTIDKIRVAPWPRVYADLRTVGVRGEDAAEHLLEVIRGR